MKNSISLIVNLLVNIFNDSPKNTLSDAAKFSANWRMRCPENGSPSLKTTESKLVTLSPALRSLWRSRALPPTKFLGEKCGLNDHKKFFIL